jgi:hypothetical protein
MTSKTLTAQIRTLTAAVYEARRDRQVHPDGSFDSAGRWYPSDAEDCGGDGTCVRSPSRAWPYSYMLRCRTRQHCRALVEAALAGETVPYDVTRAVAAAVSQTPALVEPTSLECLVELPLAA